MIEIFLYTKDAKITPRHCALLVEAGYIPVEVAVMSAVQIMPAPLPAAQLDVISKAAIEAIRDSGTYVRERFAGNLTNALASKRAP